MLFKNVGLEKYKIKMFINVEIVKFKQSPWVAEKWRLMKNL